VALKGPNSLGQTFPGLGSIFARAVPWAYAHNKGGQLGFPSRKTERHEWPISTSSGGLRPGGAGPSEKRIESSLFFSSR
jgi:hypothetical protein